MQLSVLLFLTASARQLFRRAPKSQYQSCAALVGAYEDASARVSVFGPEVFIANPSSPHHSEGNITSSTDCSCSGVIKFDHAEVYSFRYDLWQCTITWSSTPSSKEPHGVEVNVWERDGVCNRPVACDPERLDEALKGLTMQQAQAALAGSLKASEAAKSVVESVLSAAEAFQTALPSSYKGAKAVADAKKAVKLVGEAASLVQAAQEEFKAANSTEETTPPPVLLYQATASGGCAALTGDFERGSSIVEVHGNTTYISAPGAAPHASGDISHDGRCECAGDVDFGDLGEYTFKYDLYSCKLTWGQPPTLEVPHHVELNSWQRDGVCNTKMMCNPDAIAAAEKKLVVGPTPEMIGVKAEIAAIKVATAMSVAAVAGQDVVIEAVRQVKLHPSAADAMKKAAADAVAAIHEVSGPAQMAFDILAGINPRAADPARAALQAGHAMGLSADKQFASLK